MLFKNIQNLNSGLVLQLLLENSSQFQILQQKPNMHICFLFDLKFEHIDIRDF